MRRVLLLGWLLLMVTAQGHAQSFNCDDDENYVDTVGLSYTSEDGPAVIAVLGLNGADPVVYNEIDADFGICTYQTPESVTYEADLPVTGPVAPSELGVVEYLQGFDTERLRIAEAGRQAAQYLVIVEQEPGTGTLTLNATDALRMSGVDVTAYLFGLDAADPDLALQVGENAGQPLPDDATAQVTTPLAIFDGAGTLTASATPAGETLTITGGSPTQETVVVLHFGMTGAETTVRATVATGDLGLRLLCDGNLISESALRLPVTPSLRGQTLTVLGQADFDPVLAIFTETGGACLPQVDLFGYSANLPTLEIEDGLYGAQAIIPPDAESVVIGGRDDGFGDVLLLVEGELTDENSPAFYGLEITQGIRNSGSAPVAYMIALDDELNPYLGYVNADGSPVIDDAGRVIACDDAGINSLCWGETVGLRGFGVEINGVTLAGLPPDAMLAVPDALDMAPDATVYFSAATTTGFGRYVFALHLVTQ